MSELDRERREMVAVLQRPGVRPDPSLRITRRTFIHRSCLTGAATFITDGSRPWPIPPAKPGCSFNRLSNWGIEKLGN